MELTNKIAIYLVFGEKEKQKVKNENLYFLILETVIRY